MSAQPGETRSRLLTPAEVAEILQVSERKVRELMSARRIGFIQLDRRDRRVSAEQLEDFIDAGRVDAIDPHDAQPATTGDDDVDQADDDADSDGRPVAFIGEGLTGRSRLALGRS